MDVARWTDGRQAPLFGATAGQTSSLLRSAVATICACRAACSRLASRASRRPGKPAGIDAPCPLLRWHRPNRENAVLQYRRYYGRQLATCWLRYAQAGTGPRNARSGAHAAADTRAAIRVNRPASTSGRPRTDEQPHRGPARPGMPTPGLPDLVAFTGQSHCPSTRGEGQSPVKACTSVVWLPVWLPTPEKKHAFAR